MTTGMPHQDEANELRAALVGVRITEPDAEILVAVESALAMVPAPEDWHPGPSAVAG